MAQSWSSYWSATRHPWSCVLFVLPLLLIYELGLYLLGPTPPEMLRNGADVWLRTALLSVGISPTYGAPAILIAILVFWSVIYREQRSPDGVGVWVGMTVESVLFAAALYGMSRALWPLLQPMGKLFMDTGVDPQVQNMIRYVGAGIYEETLFRLLLFSALVGAFYLAGLPRLWAITLAMIISGAIFAWAHNLGPQGEAFHGPVFLYRTWAGIFFAWLFCVRGFGIAVGAHAGYDVLVGVLVR